MKVLASLVLVVLLQGVWGTPTDEEVDVVCGHYVADFVFILDASTSIYYSHFDQQLEFVVDVVEAFEIGPGLTHIGVESFADTADIHFNLRDYDTAEEISAAVLAIPQQHGQTMTNLALERLRLEMLTPDLIRENVPQVAIVITDGGSDYTMLTREQADLVKAGGTRIIAIGVGDSINPEELHAIASSDSDVLYADDYTALDSIRNSLLLVACEVPTTPVPTPPQSIIGCDGRHPLNVAFSLPSQTSVYDGNAAIDFFKNLVDQLEIGPEAQVQAAYAPRECRQEEDIFLDEYDNNIGFNNELERRKQLGAHTTNQLENVLGVLSTQAGGNEEALRTGVLIVDDAPENLEAVEAIAEVARSDGIELIVIGVGDSVSEDYLDTLAYSDAHAFSVDSYDDLGTILGDISNRICISLVARSSEPQQRRFFRRRNHHSPL